ncbi:Imm21 family immunity protein [Longispora albida]|uniref:Imm21 family immunity protein n=1 Tax=Longispora albida TaxID=203523 RepID=UPI00037DBE31|nr:Imm21 family immunity protein [Longispora albida]
MSPAWVRSLGGPLIVMPEPACREWGGASDGYADEPGDYGRARDVEDHVDVINVGGFEALVLGEEPARTTYLPEHRTFLRVTAADVDRDLPALVGELLPEADWVSHTWWTVPGPVVLFDSVYEAGQIAGEEHLRIDLEPGTYIVEAATVEAPEAYLTLVRLTPR